jgi:Aspartyl protease
MRMNWRAIVFVLPFVFLPATAARSAGTTVPFTYTHHELVVSVQIAGSGPYRFLLDSGTTPSVIDATLAKKFGLRATGAAGRGTDIGSSATPISYPVTIRDLTFGSVQVSRLNAVTQDLSPISKGLGISLAGVLGSNFFDGRVIQIDYPCRTISIMAHALRARVTARFREDPSGWIVTNDVWVDSRHASAAIDTGDAGFPIVTRAGIVALHLQTEARTGKAITSVGYAGRHRETLGTLRNVRLGSESFGTLTARLLSDANAPFDINIGNRLLQRLVVTFDYVRGLLTLSPSRSCVGLSTVD